MSRPYDLSKKSDMKKFERDLMNGVMAAAQEAIDNGVEFDIECPHCHRSISIPAGLSVCPLCTGKIDLSVQL